MANINQIKKLREETGVSLMECKKALEQAQGDLEKAKEILRKRGMEFAAKKKERETKAGIIASYIHSNKKVGVLLDLRCETDFVAQNKEFQTLSHELCLQIAAMSPKFVSPQDVPEEDLERERKIYREQFSDAGKSEKLVEEIVEGKIEKYKKEICLLPQPFIKNPDKTIQDVINEYISKLGENIVIKRFVRYEL